MPKAGSKSSNVKKQAKAKSYGIGYAIWLFLVVVGTIGLVGSLVYVTYDLWHLLFPSGSVISEYVTGWGGNAFTS